MTPSTSDGPGELRIRRWVFDDLQAIRQMTLETWLDAYRAFIPEEDLRDYWDRQFTDEALQRSVASPDVDGYVAEVDGKVVGWMRTRWDAPARRCSMTSLYVAPSHQGRGAGATLLEVAEGCARSHGVFELWLGVMEQNRSALDWYRAREFVVMETAPFTMGRTTVNHCVCVKRLGVKGPEHGR